MRVDEQVAGRQVHAVAVVARKRERALVEHADEAGLAALVRALRPPLGVGGRDEDHVARLDERAVVLVDGLVHDALVDPVGEAARVEAILEPPVAVVVEGHGRMIASGEPVDKDAQRGDSLEAEPLEDGP